MPALMEIFVALRHYTRDQQLACQANTKSLEWRLADVLFRIWDLGITSFGGPPVHIQRLHRRSVLGSGGQAPWVDEQTVGISVYSKQPMLTDELFRLTASSRAEPP